MNRTPFFWYPQQAGMRVIATLTAVTLWPLTLIWRLGAGLRKFTTSPYHPSIPTIVIGNLTAGGTGKTPVVAALAEAVIAANRHPTILTRGYGGNVKGPHLVSTTDTSTDIGDEAKWLAQFAPVVVAQHRGKGASWIETHINKCDVIIMDDGLQNPTIIPHQSIAVFNGQLGTGNGMIMPAGPMREGWGRLKSCDGVIITGDDMHDVANHAAAINPGISIMTAMRHLNPHDLKKIKDKKVYAFAGIGAPSGFFDMLRNEGVKLAGQKAFPDHHHYSLEDINTLKTEANAMGAVLVTTEKDMMRLDQDQSKSVTSIGLVSHITPSIMDMLRPAKV